MKNIAIEEQKGKHCIVSNKIFFKDNTYIYNWYDNEKNISLF